MHNRISSQNGWELLSVLCSTIPPSNELALYIIQLLNDIHPPQSASTQAGSTITAFPSPLVTSYLSLKLRRICQKGAHGKVPCRAEIQRDRMAILYQQDPEGIKGKRVVSTMVFGTPLDIIMKNQQRSNDSNNTTRQRQKQPQQERIKIPRIVPLLIHAIRRLGGHFTQGVFRVSGLSELVTALRLQIESGTGDGDDKSGFGDLNLDVCCGDPNVPASLLRIWLRELPTPLIPVDDYNRCIDHSGDLGSVMLIVDGLPDVNRRILMYIIGFIQVSQEKRFARKSRIHSCWRSCLGILIATGLPTYSHDSEQPSHGICSQLFAWPTLGESGPCFAEIKVWANVCQDFVTWTQGRYGPSALWLIPASSYLASLYWSPPCFTCRYTSSILIRLHWYPSILSPYPYRIKTIFDPPWRSGIQIPTQYT